MEQFTCPVSVDLEPARGVPRPRVALEDASHISQGGLLLRLRLGCRAIRWRVHLQVTQKASAAASWMQMSVARPVITRERTPILPRLTSSGVPKNACLHTKLGLVTWRQWNFNAVAAQELEQFADVANLIGRHSGDAATNRQRGGDVYVSLDEWQAFCVVGPAL